MISLLVGALILAYGTAVFLTVCWLTVHFPWLWCFFFAYIVGAVIMEDI